jgi:hypothetical protein
MRRGRPDKAQPPSGNGAALELACNHCGKVPFRRPDKRFTRHPAMGLVCGIGGRVPFTRRQGVSSISYAVNGTREAAALPLSIPAAPRGNRCCALRSPPACLTAAGSTRHPVSVRLCPPSMASRPCHSRFGSPISAGTQPLAVILQIKAAPVSLKARFCRPDKRQRHPALSPRYNCRMARYTLIRPTRFQQLRQ